MTVFFERLDNFMKHKNLNDNKITIEAGISNGLIGKGRKRGALSQENISKILHAYPDLNANWLFTGREDMLKADPSKKSNSDTKWINKLLDRVQELASDYALLKNENERLQKEIEKLKREAC